MKNRKLHREELEKLLVSSIDFVTQMHHTLYLHHKDIDKISQVITECEEFIISTEEALDYSQEIIDYKEEHKNDKA